MTLTVAFDHGGRQDIVDAARSLIRSRSARRRRRPGGFAAHLPFPDTPDVDLVIRTSGEQRISNFMLWQVAYAEWIFPPVLWPDFRAPHFLECLHDYRQPRPPLRRRDTASERRTPQVKDTDSSHCTRTGPGATGPYDAPGPETPERPANPCSAPGSQFHRFFNDPRWALAVVRATVLEAAHPQIGAALADNSSFVVHPWRRLRNTLVSLQRMFGADEADPAAGGGAAQPAARAAERHGRAGTARTTRWTPRCGHGWSRRSSRAP